ncbi:MAG: hypothetical protein H6818_12735 [Phycisphaerales bacterium]|nr:hypothetical protein [Phycisphaerales bacterium]
MAPLNNYLRRVTRRPALSALALVLILMPASCETSSRGPAIDEISKRTEPVSHIKHSMRLRILMREINELSLARLPQEMGTSLSERRRISSIGAIAERLSASTAELPKMAADFDLTEAQRASFVELAGFLQEESRELGRIAREGASPKLVQAKLEEMVTTCNACHRLFRDPSAGKLFAPHD